MKKLVINNKINNFNKTISVDGDKSISIRSLLLGSQSYGICKIKNLPNSEDVLHTINGLRKLGVKITFNNNVCSITGNGLGSFKINNKVTIDAGNSGTFARLLLGLLIKGTHKVKLIGDKSLSRRDFLRISEPLQKFGSSFILKNKGGLPIEIHASELIKPIQYKETRGSAQCKSSVMLAALNSPGKTIIEAKKSRDHTELFFKYLKLPIKIKRKKEFDIIQIEGEKQFCSFKYQIPGDISSSSFFVVLTILSKKSKLKIKNVNVNPSRIGFIKIINKMGGKVRIENKRKVCGEYVADLHIKSQKKIKSINCPVKFNSNAIDEFLIIFLLASKAKGVSKFSNLGELNKKESPRLKLGSNILNMMGIKTILKNNTLKIYGNPKLKIKKEIKIKNYYKDHRIFMTSVIGGLVTGGKWTIHDVNSYRSSFPSFMNILRKIGFNATYR